MDSDIEHIKQLREQTRKLLGKLWNAQHAYPDFRNTVDRVKVLGKPMSFNDISKPKKTPAKPTPFIHTAKPQNDLQKLPLLKDERVGESPIKGKYKPSSKQINEALGRTDLYYDTLQSFRKMHPDVFFKYTMKEYSPFEFNPYYYHAINLIFVLPLALIQASKISNLNKKYSKNPNHNKKTTNSYVNTSTYTHQRFRIPRVKEQGI
jgi:hypothetical protein